MALGAAAEQQGGVSLVPSDASGITPRHVGPHAAGGLHLSSQLALPVALQQAAGTGRQVGTGCRGSCLLSRRRLALRLQLGT